MDKQPKTSEEEVIDIEEYSKAGKPVPKGRHYRIRVNKDRFTVRESAITGKAILALVNQTPAEYNLYQHVRGGQTITIQPDQKVDLTAKGVERFTTLKKANTEGIS